MSGSIHLAIASPHFDLVARLKQAIEEQDKADLCGSERSMSPVPFPEDDDGDSSLSSLPPSPELLPSQASGPSMPSIFLDEAELQPVVKKQPQKKKNPQKIKNVDRQARQNASGNSARRDRRVRDANAGYHKPRERARRQHLGTAEAFFCNTNIRSLPVANGAYVGLKSASRPRVGSRKPYSLSDLVGKSSKYRFKLQEWDGSKSIGIVDRENRLVAILAGHPDVEDWPLLQDQAAKALETRRTRCSIPKEARNRAHRRGKFVTLNCGVSYGGGQQVPGNLCHNPVNEQILSELNDLEPFRRVAGFASSVMQTWAPQLYTHYEEYTNALHTEHPHLVRLFPGSVFSAASYNFGPRTVCYPHIDDGNNPYGMCSVTPFGDYDYKKGGHLVLWELRLVIEFPPGCTILLPSALVTHSNIAIGTEEKRYSFAQYTSGSLFRWVDQKFQTRAAYVEQLTPEELAADSARLAGRWEFGLSLLPTFDRK